MRNFSNNEFIEDSLNHLDSSTEIRDDMLVPSSVGEDNKSWAKKTFSKVYDYIKGKLNITANNPTLSFGETSNLASVGGVNITVTMPENPNTDESVKQSHTTANSDLSILLATDSGTGTVTGQTYKNSGVTVNGNSKKITSNGFIVSGSSYKELLTGNGATQTEHTTRNHPATVIPNLNTADDFIENYWQYFVEGNDELDTFIISPFAGATDQSFDFSVLTQYITDTGKNVSVKRFHIYLEYSGDRIWLKGCLSNADFTAGGCGAKIECYFDKQMGVWFVEYNSAMQCKEGKYYNYEKYKEYYSSKIGK